MLGRFELRLGGRVAIGRSWHRTKAKDLIKLLALQIGGSMPRDQALEALWPGVSTASAANSLYKTLHHLRTAAGTGAGTGTGTGDAIVSAGDGAITLRRDVWVDAHEFVNSCLAARSSGSIEALSCGLDLYRGELLPDDRYAPWAEPHRENLRSLFIASSLTLASWLDREGSPIAATERAAAAVQADPTLGQAQRMLMRLFARSGNPALALRQYDQYRATLRRELDLEPDQKTERLRDTIREDLRIETRTARDAASVDPPEVRYATSAQRGERVAFCSYGGGAGVPLLSMPWLPHSDIALESVIPEWRAFDERMAQRRVLLRYDPAGVGASRPGAFDFSVDAQLAEIDAVAISAGVERFAILASFHSGAAAITYAVTHPERVSHLILWCSYARGRDLRKRDELSSLTAMLGADWHVYSESAAQFLFAWEHQKLARRYASLVRESGTPEIARAFVAAVGDYDVTTLLPEVRTPTLVVHRPAMPWLDVGYAHELASCIPHARLALLDGAAAAPFVDDEAGEIACMLQEFLEQPGSLDVAGGDLSALRAG